MLLDPYACFATAPCLAAALLVSIPIAWVWLAYTSRMQRLRALEESGVARRSGRSAADM